MLSPKSRHSRPRSRPVGAFSQRTFFCLAECCSFCSALHTPWRTSPLPGKPSKTRHRTEQRKETNSKASQPLLEANGDRQGLECQRKPGRNFWRLLATAPFPPSKGRGVRQKSGRTQRPEGSLCRCGPSPPVRSPSIRFAPVRANRLPIIRHQPLRLPISPHLY